MSGRKWIIPSVLLCLFGFFKNMRPSEPFLTPYLIQVKNISEDAVDNQIYPIWTYSYLAALIPVFLFTDMLRYKPVIILEGFTYLATWALLLWASGIPLMKLMQLFYGFATATEIAYYSYLFATVSADHYQQVSSYTRSAALAGNFIAGTLGQLLYSLNKSTDTLFTLNIISMTSVAIATTISLLLPSVDFSTYFHRTQRGIQETTNGEATDDESSDTTCFGLKKVRSVNADQGQVQDHGIIDHGDNCCSNYFKTFLMNLNMLWLDFKTCYRNKHVLKWSLWWAFAACGYLQVGNYIQNLWQVIFDKSDADVGDIYNGAVEAASTLAGSLAAFCIMFCPINWDIFGEMLLGIVSVVDAILLTFMATTSNIWLCYSFYIVFRATYQLVITIATYQIAKHLNVQRYALIFGGNTLVALVLQTILTLIVVDYRTLNTPPENQFLIYGAYYFVLGILFCCKATYTMTINGWRWSWSNRRAIVSSDMSEECNTQGDDGILDTERIENSDDPRVSISDEEPLTYRQ